MDVEPEHAVVLLGAGASAAAGCPVMRGFIDRAIDFERLGRFAESEMPDIHAALGLYHAVRAHFQITEEDSENIENLLSLADLANRLISNPPLEDLKNPELSDQLRRFIEAVITKSISISSPTSPDWPEGGGSANPYGNFVRALAYLGRRVTVITLNYDCVLEYACYCLGLPFTYHRDAGDGLEILKLHGSSNWVRCRTEGCSNYGHLAISEIKHCPAEHDANDGFIERVRSVCEVCGNQLSPLIIAPTWAKSFDAELKKTWTRAVEAIADAEVLIVVGISLPESDAHLRELLHIGLSSSKLRQALAVVGEDEAAGRRWSNLFRESWRNARFEVRHAAFEIMLEVAIKPALIVPADFGGMLNQKMLPVSIGFEGMRSIEARFREEDLDPHGVEWGAVLRQIRQGILKYENCKSLVRLGLDWKPQGPALPAHGLVMP
jgi:NAD-dependent SIR2 family protein deacetylase